MNMNELTCCVYVYLCDTPLADAPDVLHSSLLLFPVIIFKLPKLPLDLLIGLFSLPSDDFPSTSMPPATAPCEKQNMI